MYLFGRPPLRAGRCLFLETLFSALRGVGRAGVTPARPPLSSSLLRTSSRARRPGFAHLFPPPWRIRRQGASAFLERLVLHEAPRVGAVGRCPLGSWRLCAGVPPRPARGGEPGLEAAPGRPRAGRAPASGLFPALAPGVGSIGSRRRRTTGGAPLFQGVAAGIGFIFAHLGVLEHNNWPWKVGGSGVHAPSPLAAEPQFAHL